LNETTGGGEFDYLMKGFYQKKRFTKRENENYGHMALP